MTEGRGDREETAIWGQGRPGLHLAPEARAVARRSNPEAVAAQA